MKSIDSLQVNRKEAFATARPTGWIIGRASRPASRTSSTKIYLRPADGTRFWAASRVPFMLQPSQASCWLQLCAHARDAYNSLRTSSPS